MARRAIPLLLTLALAVTLHAQTDATQSAVPGAGFDQSAPSAPAAQSTADGIALPANSSAPTIHVFSRETIVDVIVTDDKGRPVRGLTRSDFTILEDNHPQPIRGFSESSTSLPPPAPALPPDTYTNAHTVPSSGPVQIFLIERAVIDTPARRQISVPPGLLDYLRTMPLGTQVAIFTFSPVTALQVVQPFTTDGDAAAAAAARILPDVDLAPGYHGPSTTILQIAAMEQIATNVAGIHGRKNLIWLFAGKPPVMVTRDGGYGWAGAVGPKGPIGPPPDMSIVHRAMDVYETFSREQIAVYPVDPNGIHGLGFASMMCQDMADQTGGTYGNTNDIRGEIAEIVDRSSDIYTLSIVPPRLNEDARFHSIKILVDRPGVHLTYRTGYDDDHPRPPDRMLKADLLPAPLRLGALPATQLIFNLQVTPAPPGAAAPKINITDKRHASSSTDRAYNAVFTFDPTQIAFSETPDGKRTAKLEFDLGAFDSFSQLGPVRSQTITLNVNPSGYDDFMRKPFRFTLPIPIPPGQQTLRVGLFDTVSGKAGTLQVPLNIPKK